MDIRGLLNEQLSYYRVGAAEYDSSNRRMLLPVDDPAWSADYQRGYETGAAAAEAVSWGKDVVELAGGTGLYTERLARCAAKLTVVDASPEALQISRATVGAVRQDIDYVVADLFTWHPPRRYDAGFFAFWLSHVPHSLFAEFWDRVHQALAVGGEVVFVDSMAPMAGQDTSPAPPDEELFPEERLDDEVSVRSLTDGSRFRIVRVLWERSALRAALKQLGWDVQFDEESPWLIGRASRTAFT